MRSASFSVRVVLIAPSAPSILVKTPAFVPSIKSSNVPRMLRSANALSSTSSFFRNARGPARVPSSSPLMLGRSARVSSFAATPAPRLVFRSVRASLAAFMWGSIRVLVNTSMFSRSNLPAVMKSLNSCEPIVSNLAAWASRTPLARASVAEAASVATLMASAAVRAPVCSSNWSPSFVRMSSCTSIWAWSFCSPCVRMASLSRASSFRSATAWVRAPFSSSSVSPAVALRAATGVSSASSFFTASSRSAASSMNVSRIVASVEIAPSNASVPVTRLLMSGAAC